MFYRSRRIPDGVSLPGAVKQGDQVYLDRPSGGYGCLRVRTCHNPDMVCLEGGCIWCSPCQRERGHAGPHDFRVQVTA